MTPAANIPPPPQSGLPQLPHRPPAIHKTQAGKIVIYAGSRGMSGAAILAGLGALRGGAGLVRVVCPEAVQPIVAAAEPCFMTGVLPEPSFGCPGDGNRGGGVSPALSVAADLNWADVVAAGPGLGQTAEVAGVVTELVRATECPLVLDADALNVLAAGDAGQPGGGNPGWWVKRARRPTVITPHPGEMARLQRAAGLPDLAGDDDATRLRIAWEYARLTSVVVVLKGHRTVVAAADRTYINDTGNPGMASGGMGDVLTGLLAALIGQGLPTFDAARLAVHVHGKAADICSQQIAPQGYLAREVADVLPAAIHQATRPHIGFV